MRTVLLQITDKKQNVILRRNDEESQLKTNGDSSLRSE